MPLCANQLLNLGMRNERHTLGTLHRQEDDVLHVKFFGSPQQHAKDFLVGNLGRTQQEERVHQRERSDGVG